MNIEQTQYGEVMVIRPLERRLDAALAPLFKGRVVDLINQGHRCLAVDFGGIDFLDSTGLGSLISCLKSLGQGGRMALFSLSPNVRKVFTITKLDRGVFPILADRDEALRFLSQGS